MSVDLLVSLSGLLEALASIIALVLSFIAISQTRKQIELSNKQALFDRRLTIYTLLSEMASIYQAYRATAYSRNGQDEVVFEEKSVFMVLASTSSFEGMNDWIVSPDDCSAEKSFLDGYEKMCKTAVEAKLVFGGAVGENAYSFIDAYAILLLHIFNSIDRFGNMELDHERSNYTEIPGEQHKEVMKRNRIDIDLERLYHSYQVMVDHKTLSLAEKSISLV